MYCTQCGTFFSENGDICPACQKSKQTVCVPVNSPAQKKKRKLPWIIILCSIPIFILLGCLIFNNSGYYDIASYGQHQIINYRGSLNKLVSDDSSLLEDFLDGDVDGNRKITAIHCKDYKLEWHRFGSGGTVDVFDDNCTFYEFGLREYNKNTAGNSYDRFREDFTFTITDQTDDVYHTYHFQSRLDVLTWLKQEF